jgi:hypothetical protein
MLALVDGDEGELSKPDIILLQQNLLKLGMFFIHNLIYEVPVHSVIL